MSTPQTTIVTAADKIRAGTMTAVELVEQCLERISRDDPQLNAFIAVMHRQAREDAARTDKARASGAPLGPLSGIPISVKDLIDVAGLPTTAASRACVDAEPASTDAPVVARLRRAGAIIIGKCNLHELAFGTTGEESAFGPTRNPYGASHSAGGSSGGSAVSVATGMALASMGTDTGGSIRIPAAACGVVGLKPTFGELSCDGVLPLAPTLDHVGPIGMSVEDVATVYHVLCGGKPVSTTPRHRPTAAGIRLGIPECYFLDLLDDDVRDRFDAATERIRATGAVLDTVEIRHAAETPQTYLHTQFREAAAVHAETLAARAGDLSPGVRQRLESARSVSQDDYDRAQETRDELRQEVDGALGVRQGLLLPTLPIAAPRLGTREVTVGNLPRDLRTMMLRLTQLFNLTGHPAITIPCGATGSGLPCGAQIVGHRGQTAGMLQLAAVLEDAIRGESQ